MELSNEEKLAEEYYYKTYPVTLNIGEEERYETVTQMFLEIAEPREKRIAEAESIIKEIISTWENPRTNLPFRCAIKHAKEFIGWKE